jgi:hypothetical protein
MVSNKEKCIYKQTILFIVFVFYKKKYINNFIMFEEIIKKLNNIFF